MVRIIEDTKCMNPKADYKSSWGESGKASFISSFIHMIHQSFW